MNRRKPLPTNENLKKYAVEMRKNQTDEEKKVWYQILKGRTPKFHRQRIIGNYIVDFYCPQLRLAIEIDGYQHFYEENIEYDNKRTEYIESQDIYILRFENTEVNKDIEYVRFIIDNACDARIKGIPIAPEYR
jgi:very-short-patch-repair endonuclease